MWPSQGHWRFQRMLESRRGGSDNASIHRQKPRRPTFFILLCDLRKAVSVPADNLPLTPIGSLDPNEETRHWRSIPPGCAKAFASRIFALSLDGRRSIIIVQMSCTSEPDHIYKDRGLAKHAPPARRHAQPLRRRGLLAKQIPAGHSTRRASAEKSTFCKTNRRPTRLNQDQRYPHLLGSKT